MIKRRYIDNRHGGQIHLAEVGRNNNKHPSTLLLHQTPRSWDEFKEVMELLASDCHLIAMDLPGMGSSSPTGREATIEIYAEAASTVIEAYGGAPMAVCGHHTGGAVAVELGANHAKLVDSLVLSSAPWLNADIRAARSQKTPIDTTKPARDGHHLLDLWRQREPYYPESVDYMDRFMSDALKANDPAEGHRAVGHYHMENAIPKIKSPVLIIEHMKDPFASRHTNNLASAFRQGIVEIIADGHVALEVTATEFSKLLKNWVYRKDKSNKSKKFEMDK